MLDRLPLRLRLVVATLVGTIVFAVGFGALALVEIERLEQHSITQALQERLNVFQQDPQGRVLCVRRVHAGRAFAVIDVTPLA